MEKAVFVGIGAAVGANARYWVGVWAGGRFGVSFPWGTFVVNVSGSLIIGLLMALSLRFAWHPNLRLLLMVGLLGGYTTFSSFEYETYALISQGSFTRAVANVVGSVMLGFFGVWIGSVLGRIIIAAHR